MKIGVKHKRILSLLVIAMMLAGLAGCTTWDSFKHTFIEDSVDDGSNTICIGVFEPQTGKYSDRGLSEIKGIELANSIFNSVSGYKVQLIKVDTQSSTATAETAIQGLVEMHPVAIIGSAGEATSLIASKYITEAHIPTIAPSATNPLITQNSGYYFRASVTESQMGSGSAEYAYAELGAKKIGILVGKNDTSASAMTDGFTSTLSALIKADNKGRSDDDKIKKNDVLVVNEEAVFDDAGMKTCIENLLKKKAEVACIPQGTETMDQFFSRVEKYGATDITYIGTRDWGKEDFIEMMKKHPKIKIAFPMDTALDSENSKSTEEAERFRILYENKYGAEDEPDSYAALGYDSYLLLINAISSASSLDGQDIRDALVNTDDVKGATGVFRFDNVGNTVRTITFYTISDGNLKYIYTTKEATESKKLEDIG
ncbi:MAG: ABC transporter substrate-binding protein [Clostridiales bacterium]|nr:ABC transporter substrate-binding protein [Candidatus Crickella caballi]